MNLLKFCFVFIFFSSVIAFARADYARGMEYFRKANKEFQSGNFKEALVLIESAINEDPSNAQHFALEGNIYYNLQRLPEAKEAWQKTLELNPQLDAVKNKLSQLGREIGVEARLQESQESVFELRSDSAIVDETSKALIHGYLKEAYDKIGRDFNYYPQHKIIVLLYSSQDFEKIRTLPEWVAGLYDGKIRIPLKTLANNQQPIDGLELKRIIWHEYTHSLIFDLSAGRCPVFLNEGLAEYEGLRVKGQVTNGQRPASSGYKPYPLITYFLPENLNKNKFKLDARQFYQDSELLVKYILSVWGWEGMRVFLLQAAADASWQDAMYKAFGLSPEKLQERWLNWLK